MAILVGCVAAVLLDRATGDHDLDAGAVALIVVVGVAVISGGAARRRRADEAIDRAEPNDGCRR